jgi:hypothetical protein
MRGEGILNSKIEYSRCRIPRLTIDTEGWKKFKKEESEREKQLELQQMQSQEEDLRLTERRMDECEQSSRRMESKRKQEATKRKAKKLRLEPLVEWGEGGGRDVDQEDGTLDIWLGPTKKMEKEEDTQYDWKALPSVVKTSKLIQLELNFKSSQQSERTGKVDEILPEGWSQSDQTELEDKPADKSKGYVKKRGKISKKEAREIANKNKSMKEWLVQDKSVKDVDDDQEDFENETIAGMCEGDGALGVARKVKAKCMKTHWETRRWMNVLMNDLVGQVDARSVVDEIMDVVISDTIKDVRVKEIWKELEFDDKILKIIQDKIMKQKPISDNNIVLNSYVNLPVIVGESRTAIERGCGENAVVGGLGESLGAMPKLMDVSPKVNSNIAQPCVIIHSRGFEQNDVQQHDDVQDKIAVHSGGEGQDDGRVGGQGEAHAVHQYDGGDGELQHWGGVPDHDEDAREGQGDVHRVEGVVHRPQQLRQAKQGGRHQVPVGLVQL